MTVASSLFRTTRTSPEEKAEKRVARLPAAAHRHKPRGFDRKAGAQLRGLMRDIDRTLRVTIGVAAIDISAMAPDVRITIMATPALATPALAALAGKRMP